MSANRTVSSFHFIQCTNPATTSDRRKQSSARSRGAWQSQWRKRQRLIARNDNFRNVTVEDIDQSAAEAGGDATCLVKRPRRVPEGPRIIGVDWHDLVDIDSLKLVALLDHPRADQALEPVFSVSKKFKHQSIQAVLREGIRDSAVANALMLCLVLAANGNVVNAEVLQIKCRAIRRINDQITARQSDSMEAVIMAILLLVGAERRLGIGPDIQTHLNGARRVLEHCNARGIVLNDGVKRALFWQDLMSALTTGTRRTLSHSTFAELQWRRGGLAELYTLPEGFRTRKQLFCADLLDVLEDINALQQLRDLPSFKTPDTTTIRELDNQQAWMESRLFEHYSRARHDNVVLRTCILAAYLIAYGLFAEVWAAEWIPGHCSSQLVQQLQKCVDTELWREHEDLLAWTMFVGATFAPSTVIQSQYAGLLQGQYHDLLSGYFQSWEDTLVLLRKFLWSDTLFNHKAKRLWSATAHLRGGTVLDGT